MSLVSIHSKLINLYELNSLLSNSSIKLNIYKLLLDFIDINGEEELIKYFNKIIIRFRSSKYYTIKYEILNSINSFLDIDDFISKIDNIKGGKMKYNNNDFYNEFYIFIINQLELYIPYLKTSEKIITNEPKNNKTIRKKSISSTMKKLVWNKYIGEEIGKSKCLCCKNSYICQISFHCGDIIPESKGGEMKVSNLRPICQNCNSSMATRNMDEFMESLK